MFNLYYGALKGTNHKWLDLQKFAESLLVDGEQLTILKYFTAKPTASPVLGSRSTSGR
jgi:hypothetical protein